MAGYARTLTRDEDADLAVAAPEVTFDWSTKVGPDGERMRPVDDEMIVALMRERGYSAEEICHVLGTSSLERLEPAASNRV